MANNQQFPYGLKLAVVPSNGGAKSGDPLRYGSMTGIAQADQRSSDNTVPGDFGFAAWNVSVKGVNDSGNSAVAVGDPIFYVDGDTPKLSKKASGYFFGYALQAVSSAATATIQVLHMAGAGIYAASSIGTANLAANSVTAAKLTATLAKGAIQLPLGQWRTLATSDIPNTAATPPGGLLTKNTTPLLERVNAATDKQERINWAATGVGEVVIGGIVTPPDFDETVQPVFKVLAAMAGATDTPTLGVSAFQGVGGADLGGSTGAITGTTVAVYSKTLTAFAAAPNPYSFGITPAAHGTDALYLYAAWLEYTRK